MFHSLRNFISTFHPVVHTLFIGTLMSRIATGMSIPFLAIYLATTTDMNPLLIGIIVGVGPLASTITGPFGGSLSDRIGRKSVMLGALFIWSLAHIGFAFAEHAWMFILLSILNGACRSCFEPVSQALMMDLTPKELRYRVFSVRYTFANLGFAVGPMIGAFLGIAGGNLTFIVTATFFVLYGLTLTILLSRIEMIEVDQDENAKKVPITMRAALKVAATDKILFYYILGGLLMQVVYSQSTATLSQHLEMNFIDGVKLFAWLMTTNAITVVLFQVPLSSIAEKRSPLWGISVGNILYALGGIGFALAQGWPTMIAAMFIFTLGEVMCFPAGNVMIDRIAPTGMRGTYFGAQNLKEVGRFIGPTFGMFMLHSYGVLPLFICMAVVCAGSAYFYFVGYRIELSKRSPIVLNSQVKEHV